ncbi:MAG: peptide chain release factor 1 [Candidatus Margulisiibacteriota bacterium]
MLLKKLETIETRYRELEELLSQPEIISDRNAFHKYSKELADLREIVNKAQDLKLVINSRKEAEQMASDPEMKELAENELKELKVKQESLEKEIEILLLPKDPNDEKNTIIEIRGGTGGEEAALFAGELLRMYLRYAERHNWKTEIMDANPTGLGGYKEVVFSVVGKGVYSRLKYEGGTHRVQRVPATEASGRIHTSAATVAVMPEAEEVDLKIDEKDLTFEAFRGGGAGGQNVNKVSSAVRIVHIPSGLVVECREERSQLQNRQKALKLLRTRLYDAEAEKLRKTREETRRVMVGSGDRSEKIRTYNYPQGRVTDHRIGFTMYQMQDFLDGNMDELIDALSTADRIAKLSNLK